MRSGSMPDMDTMTQLFLHAVRSGMTDMALLLARQVPDLTAQNMWGENALTMAAMMVSGVSCGALRQPCAWEGSWSHCFTGGPAVIVFYTTFSSHLILLCEIVALTIVVTFFTQ